MPERRSDDVSAEPAGTVASFSVPVDLSAVAFGSGGVSAFGDSLLLAAGDAVGVSASVELGAGVDVGGFGGVGTFGTPD